MVSALEQMQVPNGTEPGVRRSKRLLLASNKRCKCSMETSRDKINNVNKGNKVKFGTEVTT